MGIEYVHYLIPEDNTYNWSFANSRSSLSK
jgi:hypothetical protein